MTSMIKTAVRVVVTLAMVVCGIAGGRLLWVRYHDEPWTRDGRLRAEVVLVSPDVNGLVTGVSVKDGQAVHVGDTLFHIDPARYQLALRQAEATVAADAANLDEAERENRRNKSLGNLATVEQSEAAETKVLALRAALEGARATRETAALNLERTVVKATVNGVVTNLELQPGDYASAGRQVLALVNSDSFYADGYFEETKLVAIRVGDKATVHMMGVDTDLDGTVESIATAIEDRERGPSGDALPNVNPTFSWVRLAQRIPVRIRLDHVPGDVRLIAGRTATISIVVPKDRKHEGAAG